MAGVGRLLEVSVGVPGAGTANGGCGCGGLGRCGGRRLGRGTTSVDAGRWQCASVGVITCPRSGRWGCRGLRGNRCRCVGGCGHSGVCRVGGAYGAPVVDGGAYDAGVVVAPGGRGRRDDGGRGGRRLGDRGGGSSTQVWRGVARPGSGRWGGGDRRCGGRCRCRCRWGRGGYRATHCAARVVASPSCWRGRGDGWRHRGGRLSDRWRCGSCRECVASPVSGRWSGGGGRSCCRHAGRNGIGWRLGCGGRRSGSRCAGVAAAINGGRHSRIFAALIYTCGARA